MDRNKKVNGRLQHDDSSCAAGIDLVAANIVLDQIENITQNEG